MPGVATPPPGSPAPDASGVPNVPPGSGRQPAFGAYLDYGEDGVRSIAAYSRWLGGAEVRVGHTYLPGDRWENIEGGHGFLDPWAEWRRAKADRMFVLNVPMLERNEEGLGDAEVRGLLRRGAAGEFDQHFYRLAERLVRLGVPDTVLVPGWEMNGTTYTHRCGPDPTAWKQYWTRLVTVMRLVPGQKFRFDFAPSRGRDAIPWTECYPGDDVVDIIGMDAYDQPSGLSFEEQVAEPYGLRDHVAFAAAHRKPISFPEWGLFRGGGNRGDTDNVTYMQGMLDWIDTHKPLYQTITDYCPHGVWQCHQNPRSAALYRAYLSGGSAPAEPGWPEEPGIPDPEIPDPELPEEPREPDDECGPGWLPDWVGDAVC
ncbi:glycoside hydrolase family 26 protein [Streptomyces sp. NA04227]|uniref:glycoside hydrolase family 26 protein n=1 Tax=Streptomyces sp. NA04227 TaxID=2742136 RepID=UPI0020CA52F8|nr:glycosyl hydrolase [Streptomyces sp. NA04227]